MKLKPAPLKETYKLCSTLKITLRSRFLLGGGGKYNMTCKNCGPNFNRLESMRMLFKLCKNPLLARLLKKSEINDLFHIPG